jgi:predicted ArsR family transcriptional regulator
VLGHPKNFSTLDELEYLVPKNRSAIREHLDRLVDKQVIAKYTYVGVGPSVTIHESFGG